MGMRRLLVNDVMTCLPGTRTFWHDLQEWFGMEFVGGEYATLADIADSKARPSGDSEETSFFYGAATLPEPEEPQEPWPSLIVRNATWFGPLEASKRVPTISLLQDILDDKTTQKAVIASSHTVVANSPFTNAQYIPLVAPLNLAEPRFRVIPLPVDFRLFEPGNTMGLQQALGLPDGCVCWVGACTGAAAEVKGWDTFLRVVRTNPDIPFVAVFKDALPEYVPPNLRAYVKLPHTELARVYGACRVGLCTSRVETQHLAGIEMGACGLPVVAPPVGCYYSREVMEGIIVQNPDVSTFTTAIRSALSQPNDPQETRNYWRKEFDREAVRSQWTRLIEEVESQ